jgi:hypothetical protein
MISDTSSIALALMHKNSRQWWEYFYFPSTALLSSFLFYPSFKKQTLIRGKKYGPTHSYASNSLTIELKNI